MAKKKKQHGGKRAGAGRPATGATPKRTIKVDDERWERWKRSADAAGVDLSAWIRAACDAASK